MVSCRKMTPYWDIDFQTLSSHFRKNLRFMPHMTSRKLSPTSDVYPKRGWSFRSKSSWRNLPNQFFEELDHDSDKPSECTLFRNSYCTLWRKCNFTLSIFKTFICDKTTTFNKVSQLNDLISNTHEIGNKTKASARLRSFYASNENQTTKIFSDLIFLFFEK